MHEELALVVGRAAGIDLSVFDDGIEGTTVPEFQRIGRLHIVVTVDQHSRLARIGDLFAIDDGMTIGRIDLCFVDAGLQEPLFDGLGALEHIGFVFAARADRGDTEETEEFVEEAVFIFFLVSFPRLHVDEFYFPMHRGLAADGERQR